MTIKLLPADLVRHVIRPREAFKWETLFHDTLHALLLYGWMGWSAPEI